MEEQSIKETGNAKPSWLDDVESLLEAPIAQIGFLLLEVQAVNSGKKIILQVLIDGENGIGVDDCAQVSRLIFPLLDVSQIVPYAYDLEISSGGIFRPLREKKHFIQSMGKVVRVVINQQWSLSDEDKWETFPVIRGTLTDVTDAHFAIQAIDQPEKRIPWHGIKKARLDPDLDSSSSKTPKKKFN